MARTKKEIKEPTKYITRTEALKLLRLDPNTYSSAIKKLEIKPRKMVIDGRNRIVLTEEEVNRIRSITDAATIIRNFYKYENDSL